MTASSQTQPGAQPPELPPQPHPVAPLHQALTLSVSAAAAAVIDAEMQENGAATGEELAAAERAAGILFDAASVEAAVTAARDQAHAEDQAELDAVRAELADARRELALLAGDHRRRDAVLRLCEGRRGDELLLVSAVATAAECGTTALDGLPMTLTWKRSASVPENTDRVQQVTIHCESSYGGRADLVVDDDDRMALASLLDAEVIRDIHAPCPHERGCGSDDAHLDSSGVFGWTRVEVAGIDGGPRWYCSPQCVFAALARAGEDLAAIEETTAGGAL